MHDVTGGATRRTSPLEPRRNARNKMGGYALLRGLPRRSVAQVWFDPQFRGVLDSMNYGNEGESRGKERSALTQMSDYSIALWVEEAARVLAGSGHLMLWIDKFMLGTGRQARLLQHAPTLQIVDVMSWNKDRIGMGRRSRCQTEFLIIAQKFPIRGNWSDHGIPDCWTEKPRRDRHPHEKPRQLIERLIRATTRAGDIVVDPCAGSYVVLEACQAAGREFLGCDLI